MPRGEGHRRWDRIKKALMKEVSDIIQKQVKNLDRFGMVSVTDMDLSSDYRYAKVYISVYGDDEQKEKVMEILEESTPYVRSEIGKRIRLRCTPEIKFLKDESFERGTKITELINKISRGEV